MAGHPGRLGGAAGLAGVAPAAQVLPIRDPRLGAAPQTARTQLLGRGDVLIAGLERAVDPDADGDVEDAAEIALAAVVEPYAAFPDSPESRAVAGAPGSARWSSRPAGNDGRAGRGFGSVGAPGGAPTRSRVGALDSRADVARRADDVSGSATTTVLDEHVARRSAPSPPEGDASPSGAPRPDARRPGAAGRRAVATVRRSPTSSTPQGVSLVAGRAALVLAAGGAWRRRSRNAAAAGASALVVYGAATSGRARSTSTRRPPSPVLRDSARRPVARCVDGLARGEVVVASPWCGAARRQREAGQRRPLLVRRPRLRRPASSRTSSRPASGSRPRTRARTSTARRATRRRRDRASPRPSSRAPPRLLAQARPGPHARRELRSLLVGSASSSCGGGRRRPRHRPGCRASSIRPPRPPGGRRRARLARLRPRGPDRAGSVTQTVTVRNLSTPRARRRLRDRPRPLGERRSSPSRPRRRT